MLAIAVGCGKFDQYTSIYGCKATSINGCKAYVKTDHKPLVSITKKPIYTAPKQLQIHLQRYDIELICKRGKEMNITDALSKANPS